MDKKIRLLKIIFPVVLVIGFLLTACMDDYRRHSYYDEYLTASFGLVQKSTSDASFLINLDNGSILTPDNTSILGSAPQDSERVWVRFRPISDTRLTDSTFNYFAKVYSIKSILFKDIKKITQVLEDSVGHDPIFIRDAWISPKDILNLDLEFYSEGSVHYINLIDNLEANGINNPFILELRHNARGDANRYLGHALVSFKLNYLRVPGKNQVKFFIRYTDYNGNRIDMPKTYSY